jgi:hypothetical protein
MSEQGGDHIRERAYKIWQEEGEPHGRHEEHWARAEQESQEDTPNEGEPATDQTAEDDNADQPTPPLAAEQLSEPAATTAPTDPAVAAPPAKPKARRTTKKGAA